MVEIIAIIIFVSSIFGILVIIFRKIPVLAALPEIFPAKESLILKFKKRIKEINPFKGFFYELFLHKFLVKMRILNLKADNKIFSWLQKLRENYQKKKTLKFNNYWRKIRKEVKKVAKPKYFDGKAPRPK